MSPCRSWISWLSPTSLRASRDLRSASRGERADGAGRRDRARLRAPRRARDSPRTASGLCWKPAMSVELPYERMLSARVSSGTAEVPVAPKRRSYQRMPSMGSINIQNCSSPVAMRRPRVTSPPADAQASAARSCPARPWRRRSGPACEHQAARVHVQGLGDPKEVTACARWTTSASVDSSTAAIANSRIVSSKPRRPLPHLRTRLFSTSDSSRSKIPDRHTASAASTEKLPRNAASRRKRLCSSSR